MSPIYLDYAATTPAAPEVAEVVAACLTLEGCFANPASRSHLLGWEAEQRVELARRQVAQLIQADPREIIWTSGATEANNLALIGAALACDQPGHLITSEIEHKAVLDPCHWLTSQGWQVTYLKPDAQGQIQASALQAALRPETRLVSLMLINNELGSINPIHELAAVVKDHPALLHVDAAQAVGKWPIDLTELDVDLLSMSAHKFYGPKGVGALFVRGACRSRVKPLIHGGGHEMGLRSGTLATHQLAGMGQAAELAQQQMDQDRLHLQSCREAFLSNLDPQVAQPHIAPESAWPGILNLAFPGLEAESLILALPELAVSTGSACNSASLKPSYVLTALGVPATLALSSIRFSFGRYLSVEQAAEAGQKLNAVVKRLLAS